MIAVVGLCSALVSPCYLRTSGRSWFTATRSRHAYYVAFYVFWAALLAIPVAGNLAIAWLLVEATTAASALLVAFSGRREALEAGWKYLVLTTLGLVGRAAGDHRALSRRPSSATAGCTHWTGTRSRRPPSAARTTRAGRLRADHRRAGDEGRLGTGAQLAARRAQRGAARRSAPCCRPRCCRRCCSWPGGCRRRSSRRRPAPAARCSSASGWPRWRRSPVPLAPAAVEAAAGLLEPRAHGRLALGIGFGTPLATAGVVLHVAGHALAKSLGFYAALPLLRADPDADDAAAPGVARPAPPSARRGRASAWPRWPALPPSPLFVCELLILLGGVAAGETVVAVVAAVAAGARLPRAAARADRGPRRRAASAARRSARTAATRAPHRDVCTRRRAARVTAVALPAAGLGPVERWWRALL